VVGVLVEGDDDRQRVMLAGVVDGLPDDLLMAEVDAVKHANGQADLAAAIAEFRSGANFFHR